MKARIAVLPGDGVGPGGHGGGRARARARSPRDSATTSSSSRRRSARPRWTRARSRCRRRRSALARESDAVLFGAIGSPRHSDPSSKVRPEQAILGLRQALGLFANLRPVAPHAALRHASPLRDELLDGVEPADRARADRRDLLRPPHARRRCGDRRMPLHGRGGRAHRARRLPARRDTQFRA